MKKITEEDAKKVSGGSEFRNGKTFSGWVGQYDGIRGNYYFVIHDREENWFAGWMLDTWEKDAGCYTQRRHKFKIDFGFRDYYPSGSTKEVMGADWSLYTQCDKYPRKGSISV